jgi:putative transposase
MKLGIVHQRIPPRSPQENGAHERMHKTLKAKTTRPPASTQAGQQRKFDDFQNEYNFQRPHEALSDETPGSLWLPSCRRFPDRCNPPEYPGHFEVRRVSEAGCFKLNHGQQFLSNALKHEHIGLHPVDDGLWDIIFYQTLLGRFDERTRSISGASFRGGKC